MNAGDEHDAQAPSIQGMRVLLGPGDTASFPTRLARALAEEGASCWVVDLVQHQYSAGPDKLGKAKLWGARLSRLASKLNAGGSLGQALASLIKTLGQFVVFLWALVRVDALVFVSSRSLLPGYIDLPIYRLLGKRVIRIFLGTDARPRYMTGWHNDVTDPATREEACKKLARRIRRQRARVRFMSRHADIVIDNPLGGHYQTRPYINWFHVGFPHDPSFYDSGQAIDHAASQRIKILHSPSNPTVKGTEQIEAVIDKLKTEGIDLDYTRITGMPHAEVIRQLRSCDLVIDQLYSDSPMAGFASEAAAFGKPVIVGGYGWQSLRNRLGEQLAPNLLCTPEVFEQTLRNAISDLDKARAVGKQAHVFMNGYWHQTAVANRFTKLLTGERIPEGWWVDPNSIDYWQGLGATDEHRKAAITNLVAEQGLEALGLEPGQAVYKTIKSWLEQH